MIEIQTAIYDREWSVTASDNTGFKLDCRCGIIILSDQYGNGICEFIASDIRDNLEIKMKDYEDAGRCQDQLINWMHEMEDMASHVCDDLCRHPHNAKDQDDLDRICENCPVSAHRMKLLEMT